MFRNLARGSTILKSSKNAVNRQIRHKSQINSAGAASPFLAIGAACVAAWVIQGGSDDVIENPTSELPPLRKETAASVIGLRNGNPAKGLIAEEVNGVTVIKKSEKKEAITEPDPKAQNEETPVVAVLEPEPIQASTVEEVQVEEIPVESKVDDVVIEPIIEEVIAPVKPEIIEVVEQPEPVVEEIVEAVEVVAEVATEAVQIVEEIVTVAEAAAEEVIEVVKEAELVTEKVVEVTEAAVESVTETVQEVVEAVEAVAETAEAIVESAVEVAEEAIQTTEAIIETVVETVEVVKETAESVVETTKEAVTEVVESTEAAVEIVVETAEKVVDAVEKAEELTESIVEQAVVASEVVVETAEVVVQEVASTIEETVEASESVAEVVIEAAVELVETTAVQAETIVETAPVEEVVEEKVIEEVVVEAEPIPEAVSVDKSLEEAAVAIEVKELIEEINAPEAAPQEPLAAIEDAVPSDIFPTLSSENKSESPIIDSVEAIADVVAAESPPPAQSLENVVVSSGETAVEVIENVSNVTETIAEVAETVSVIAESVIAVAEPVIETIQDNIEAVTESINKTIQEVNDVPVEEILVTEQISNVKEETEEVTLPEEPTVVPVEVELAETTAAPAVTEPNENGSESIAEMLDAVPEATEIIDINESLTESITDKGIIEKEAVLETTEIVEPVTLEMAAVAESTEILEPVTLETAAVVETAETITEEVSIDNVPAQETVESSIAVVAGEEEKEQTPILVEGEEYIAPIEGQKEEVIYPEVPPEVPYVIVGGGTAAYAAVRAIRKYDPAAKIIILSKEDQAPYNRTPLSKEMWFTTEENVKSATYLDFRDKQRSLYHEKFDFYCTSKELQSREDYGGTALLLGAEVDKLNPTDKKVILTNGSEIKYEKCLLAIGGNPKNLPVFDNAPDEVKEDVTLFRGLTDFWKLDQISKKPGDIAIVGSGFLGAELAYALGERAKENKELKVTQICRETGILGAVLPRHLSDYASEEIESCGVNVVRNAELESVKKTCCGKLNMTMKDGREVRADHVVVAAGIDIDHSIAQKSGLEFDSHRGGMIVNSELESRRDIYVAGDAANFYDIRLGRRRVEHYDHAIVTGRLAGENMTGKRKAYSHQSMFWSDIGPNIGFEAMGLVDSRLKSVSVFAETESGQSDIVKNDEIKQNKYDKGVVFYLRNGTIVGVITWNIFGKMGLARRLIAMESSDNDYSELAKLFNVNK